ncbi:MAG: nucleotidyltransferase family protein [Alphaproteobacteria bacterium]|nr:MAG: nucleotidyltransferase family protein [Alphaproteobacteria bacterium]
MPVRAAMVLAAGFGTRMGSLVADRPKPLLTVHGRSLIDRVLDRIAAAGIGRVVVNLHYLGHMIRAHLAARTDLEIAFSEEPEILETGGGLRAALPLLGAGPVLVMNADAVWTGPCPVPRLLAGWRPGLEGLLDLVPVGRASAHAGPGDFFLDRAGRLARRGAAARAPYVYTGAQILDTARLAEMPPGAFPLGPVWDAMIAAGRLAGSVHPGGWIDAGTPQGLAAAEALADTAGA